MPASTRPSRALRLCLAALLCLVAAVLGHSTPAVADDGSQSAGFQQIDDFFGTYMVSPMFKVLFWDMAFWDNTLPEGEGVGSMVDGKRVVAHDAQGYQLRAEQTVSITSARRVLDGPVLLALGDLSLEVQSQGDGYVGRVLPGQSVELGGCLDAASCGAALTDLQTATDGDRLVLPSRVFRTSLAAAEVPDGTRVLEDRAPFPVAVTVTTDQSPDQSPGTLQTLGQQVQLPPGVLAPRPGDLVVVDGQQWQAVDVVGHELVVQEPTAQVLAGRLPNPDGHDLPLVVAWLVFGACFFTLRMSFINLRGMGHAIKVTAGHYDNPDDVGEVSHFQALSAALSATVGLGNIAGVAIAVAAGGPGAIFWMIVAGFLGMSSKFTECTLGQMYRVVDDAGRVSGGPMQYLGRGLAERGLGPLGKVLAVVFALMCIGGSLGGGNMFQANQSFAAVADVVPAFAPKALGAVQFQRASVDETLEIPAHTVVGVAGDGPTFQTQEAAVFAAGEATSAVVGVVAIRSGTQSNVQPGAISEVIDLAGMSTSVSTSVNTSVTNATATAGGAPSRSWIYGILLSIAVGSVILGGIKSIGRVAGIVVPVMCGVYVLAGLYIVLVNADQVPAAVGHIMSQAFTPEAGRGGLLGVLVQGFRRAAFSNEAGVGSASIAHSAAATDEPVREGIVASLGPFIDTIIVCTMTGLVVVITGTYKMDAADGVLLTSAAFGSVIDWFPLILSFAVVMFAFSTMISWSYYGERCATWLLGDWASVPYKVVFLVCIFFGSVFKLGNVLDFSDLMILGMAFPNILGVLILSGKVRVALDDYWGRLKSGQMQPRR